MKINITNMQVVILASVGCMMSIANASECASVNFLPSKIDGKKNVLEFVANDGMEVSQPNNFRQIVSGDKSYSLSAGEHTFLIRSWEKSAYITKQRNLRKGKSTSQNIVPITKVVHVNLAGNMQYDFGSLDGQNISIINQKQKVVDGCENNALDSTSEVKNISADNLPDDLKQRLYSTLSKLPTIKNELNNIFPIKVSGYFGTVLDKEYTKTNDSLLVNIVIPYSLAANLALRKGDQIVSLGDKKLTPTDLTPAKVLNEYLSSVEYGEKIEMSVSRNGEVIKLTHDYIPVVIPQVFFQTSNSKNNVINQIKIGNKLQFELDQLVLALSEHYATQSMTTDVNLIVPTKKNESELIMNIGLAEINKAKDNLLSLNGKSNKLDDIFNKHNQKRARSGQSLYHDYINKL